MGGWIRKRGCFSWTESSSRSELMSLDAREKNCARQRPGCRGLRLGALSSLQPQAPPAPLPVCPRLTLTSSLPCSPCAPQVLLQALAALQGPNSQTGHHSAGRLGGRLGRGLGRYTHSNWSAKYAFGVNSLLTKGVSKKGGNHHAKASSDTSSEVKRNRNNVPPISTFLLKWPLFPSPVPLCFLSIINTLH